MKQKVLGGANYKQVFHLHELLAGHREFMWGAGQLCYMRLPHNGPHTCQDSPPVNLSTESTSATSQAPPSVLTENCWQSTLLEKQT